MLPEVNLDRVHLTWCMDILKKMKDVVESDASTEDKFQALSWYVKQGLKVEPDYYSNIW